MKFEKSTLYRSGKGFIGLMEWTVSVLALGYFIGKYLFP